MHAAIPTCAGMAIKSESFLEKWNDCLNQATFLGLRSVRFATGFAALRVRFAAA